MLSQNLKFNEDGTISAEQVYSFLAKGYTIVRINDPYHIYFMDITNKIQKGTYSNNIEVVTTYKMFEVKPISRTELNDFLDEYYEDDFRPFYFMAGAINFCLEAMANNGGFEVKPQMKRTVKKTEDTINTTKKNEGDKAKMKNTDSNTNTTQVLSFNDVSNLVKARIKKNDENHKAMMNELLDTFNHDLETKINTDNFVKQEIDSKHIRITIELILPRNSYRVKDINNQPTDYDTNMFEELVELLKKSGADTAEIKHTRMETTSLKMTYSIVVSYVVEID